ncbi:MAG: DNA polymerase III subunit delta [Planctomycetes bacterium]|nr:DNA polymerase III subunit delta [Planctomycetota bacterium]
MEFSALAGEIKASRGLAPIYVLVGVESYLRDQGVELLKAAGEDLARNAVRISASDSTWPQVAADLYTPPFLGGRKLVILADEGNFVHNHARELMEYAAAPSPTAVLAALVPSEKLAGIKEGTTLRIVECRPMRPAERVRWVQSEIQRSGKAVDRAAAELLCRRAGDSLAELAGHVTNLVTYVGARPRIAVEDVERLVVGLPEREVYELALAAARKRRKEALEVARTLLMSGEAPQVLLWRLGWQYRKLIEAKKLILAGRRRFEVTSLLQITYFPDEFLSLVDAHALEELLEKHGEILAADVALKTTGGQEQAIMESLVLRLAA